MKWLKNLFNKKKPTPTQEWQQLERDEHGRWIIPQPTPLLGVVSPHADTRCKCGGQCDNCSKELEASINRHPAGKKKTNVTDTKTISGTKASIGSDNPLLGKDGKTKTAPTGKKPAPKPSRTRKPSDPK